MILLSKMSIFEAYFLFSKTMLIYIYIFKFFHIMEFIKLKRYPIKFVISINTYLI